MMNVRITEILHPPRPNFALAGKSLRLHPVDDIDLAPPSGIVANDVECRKTSAGSRSKQTSLSAQFSGGLLAALTNQSTQLVKVDVCWHRRDPEQRSRSAAPESSRTVSGGAPPPRPFEGWEGSNSNSKTIDYRLECDEEMVEDASPLFGPVRETRTFQPVGPIPRPRLATQNDMAGDVESTAQLVVKSRRGRDRHFNLRPRGMKLLKTRDQPTKGKGSGGANA
jgi:hypothetical protein